MNQDNQNPRISNNTDTRSGNFSVPRESQYFSTVQTNQDLRAGPTRQEQLPVEKEVVQEPFIPTEEVAANQEPTEINNDQNLEEQEISNWRAQETIIGAKSKMWYILFLIGTVGLLAFSIFIQEYSFSALIVVSAAAILLTRTNSKRSSNLINYSLTTRGFWIGQKFYDYSSFKYFGYIKEKDVNSIIFVPKERFAPAVPIYFPDEVGEKITDIIGARLPMDEVGHNIIDKIIRKINL